MTESAIRHPVVAGAAATPRAASWRPAPLRAALLAGCAAAVMLAAWVGEPAAALAADAELARLLRGMALMKAGLVAAAVAALWWRYGRPLPAQAAVVTIVGAWLLAGASMLVWQLTWIPLAAAGFHLAELTMLFVLWREHRSLPSRA